MIERVLPVGEWSRLDATGLAPVWRTFDPMATHVCVIEEHGEILAHWVAVQLWHVEAIYTKRPALFRRLWRLMGRTLEALGVRQVWTGAAQEDRYVREMLARVGAVPVAMDHFIVRVRPPDIQEVSPEEIPCLSSH